MKQHGFTLLEVIIALTIVGLALGTIFGLSAGTKRLAFRAQDSIQRILYLRAALNAAQAQPQPDYPKFPEALAEQHEITPGDLLEKSARQTMPIYYALEPYRITAQDGKDLVLETWRWKRMDTVR